MFEPTRGMERITKRQSAAITSVWCRNGSRLRTEGQESKRKGDEEDQRRAVESGSGNYNWRRRADEIGENRSPDRRTGNGTEAVHARNRALQEPLLVGRQCAGHQSHDRGLRDRPAEKRE